MTSTFSLGLNSSARTRSPGFRSPLVPSPRRNSRRNFTPSADDFFNCPAVALLIRDFLTNSIRPNCTASYPSIAGVLRCTTTHGPALSTVSGTTWPSGRNTCVIPIFLPKIPGLISNSGRDMSRPYLFAAAKRLDLYVYARRQIQLHQRIHRVLRRLKNIEQALVGPDFKLLPALFIHVGRTKHRVEISHGRQRNGSRHRCPGAFGRIDDFGRRLVQDPVIVRLEANANALF